MKRILFTAIAIAINVAALAPAAQAATNIGWGIVIGNEPPPARYEVVPAPRRGYEWAPGYWNWNGHRHVWSRGHWERVHAGQRYVRPEWEHVDNGWRLNRGGWHEAGPNGDRDHDGVPNRRDDHPDNPHRN